ncbi:hypothetical protein ID858_16985 [Xenorhabdus sp. DI]|uniref:hypothetical protein n=1 Tax=Xenorhabdus doucetiae TaxID=351671 RepID=UPI0019B09985|nr:MULTISPECIES: hypothetical protein [unclassified Xenorhabdus]MBD2786358.1 hypothetical protein [Xenorhabdus sp. 3]MBD2790188.1 hypothetical protein [Xenorhabdus sp. DI]MBD2797487.1 hypothetical protein [Xenorhabdus sp. 18]
MIRKLLLLSVTLTIAGCSVGRVSTDNLTSLNNSSLCRALGENADNGDITARILNEISSRGDSIDAEECHSIEAFARRDFGVRDFWFLDIQKMNNQITRDILQMKADGRL